MEQKKIMTIEDLQEENASLRKENRRLDQSRAGLIDKNQVLGEFIRTRLEDILLLAKQFRDEYQHYAEFVHKISRDEAQAIGGIDDNSKEIDI